VAAHSTPMSKPKLRNLEWSRNIAEEHSGVRPDLVLAQCGVAEISAIS